MTPFFSSEPAIKLHDELLGGKHYHHHHDEGDCTMQRAAEAEQRGTTPGCTAMLIVLDGIPQQDVGGGGPTIPATEFLLDLTPEEIESVQVLSPVQARFRFGAQGDRGALVIETRRGGRGGRP